jgi:hypothetical protein
MPKKLASILHLILCKQNHDSEDINGNKCDWYIESQQVEEWEKPEHKIWLNKAEGLLLLSGKTETELESLMQKLINVIEQINTQKKRFKELAEVIDVIITETTST